MLYIRGDGNSLTHFWGLASGHRRSCFLAFLNADRPVVWQAVVLLGYHGFYSGFVLEQVVLLVARGLPRKLGVGGETMAILLSFRLLFPHSSVSWYLRMHNISGI